MKLLTITTVSLISYRGFNTSMRAPSIDVSISPRGPGINRRIAMAVGASTRCLALFANSRKGGFRHSHVGTVVRRS